MRCQDVLKMLSPYLDDALEPDEMAAVRGHLASCPACRAEWEMLATTSGLLRELPEVAPPAEFRSGLSEKLAALPVTEPKKHRFGLAKNLVKAPWYRTAAVAAVATMILGLTAMWNGNITQLALKSPTSEQVATTNRDGENISRESGKSIATDNTKSKSTSTSIAKTDNAAKPDSAPKAADTPQTAAPSSAGEGNVQPVQQQPVIPPDNASPEDYTKALSSGSYTVRKASLRLSVDNKDQALKEIGTVLSANNGQATVPYSPSTGSLTITVPADGYNSTLEKLQQIGNVLSVVPSTQDLTADFQDAQKSMANLVAQKEQLEKELAGSKGDSGPLQENLASVNAQLATQQNRLKSLENQVSNATIDIMLQ